MTRVLAIVAGTRYKNLDGSSRSDAVLENVEIDGQLTLEREPGNPYDENAVAVLASGRQIGFLPAHLSEIFAPLIDAGRQLSVRTVSIGVDSYGAPVVTIELIYDEAVLDF